MEAGESLELPHVGARLRDCTTPSKTIVREARILPELPVWSLVPMRGLVDRQEFVGRKILAREDHGRDSGIGR